MIQGLIYNIELGDRHKRITTLRDRIIKPTEYNIYVYLRNECNQYGSCSTSVENIRNDLFPQNKKPSMDWINKVLRRLLNLKLVYFKDRKGVAGSFEVYFDDFILPNGNYSNIREHKKAKTILGKTQGNDVSVSEEEPEVTSNNRMLPANNSSVVAEKSSTTSKNAVVGTNTDTNTNKDKDTVPVFMSPEELSCLRHRYFCIIVAGVCVASWIFMILRWLL